MEQTFDLLIRNALVIDGANTPRYEADVGVRGDRIVAVGSLSDASAPTQIDAAGRVLAPGFIDAHTHDDRMLFSNPAMAPKVSQGVTTVVAGNCGISLAPAPNGMHKPITPPLDLLDVSGAWFQYPNFARYLNALRTTPAATNSALLVGHTTLRVNCMRDLERPADADEVAAMRAQVEEALGAGAIGVSTGLHYEPARAASTEEVIEVCRPLSTHGGLYCTHMRDEGDDVLLSLDETFRIGRELGVAVVISHHKVNGVANHGRSTETLAYIARQSALQTVGLDAYPYEASSTVLSAARVASASRTLVTWSTPHPECAGQDIEEVARRFGVSVDDAVARLLPAGAIYFSMSEADVRRILAYGPTMIGSDGLPHDEFPHPRLWATFARVLGHYSRDVGLFPLELAVHKMTGLTATTFGLPDRGTVRVGAYADLVLFDPAAIMGVADFAHPTAPAAGIDLVVVNGLAVWHNGASTGRRPGRVLARARPAAN